MSQQAALPAAHAEVPSTSSQHTSALAPLDVPPGRPSHQASVEYLTEEGPSTPEVFSSSSSWESEPINSGRHSRGAAAEPQRRPPRSPERHVQRTHPFGPYFLRTKLFVGQLQDSGPEWGHNESNRNPEGRC